jgi:hypothetical protein
MKKVMLGTPVYASVSFEYHASMIDTIMSFEPSKEYQIEPYYVNNCSLVMDGRNKICHQFLHSEGQEDYLVFIDADMSWTPQDLQKLIDSADETHRVIAGIYPKKKFESETSKYGVIDSSLFYPTDKISNFIVPVKTAGTGFLLISRSVLLDFEKFYPDLRFIDDENGDKMTLFFDTHLIGNSHYGEDTYFCYLLTQMNEPIFARIDLDLGHEGTHIYHGKPIVKKKETNCLQSYY